jgi:N-glycosylase/DNA lyase
VARQPAVQGAFQARRWRIPDFDLGETLACGQTFSWVEVGDGWWEGWILGVPVRARQDGRWVAIEGPGLPKEPQIRRYFGWEHEWAEIRASFPADTWLAEAIAYAPGLRILRQEVWETLACFICSSLKQIGQIAQINRDLRRRLGREVVGGRWDFPPVGRVWEAGEDVLRACRMGYRARHLHAAAGQLVRGEVDLAGLDRLPTDAAREQLMSLQGVGPKVADCVLLFSLGRLEAFPVDVWVERALRELYFKREKNVTTARLREHSRTYFGPYGGYAQQFLFHWFRRRAVRAEHHASSC